MTMRLNHIHRISRQFFENQQNEICSHLSEKVSKGRFFKPEKLQNHSNEGKEKKERAGRRKGGEDKKAMVALLVFHNSHFGDAKRSFGNQKKAAKSISYGSQ